MNKIAIIGPPGAGKTTLACELGEILDIEVIHLDRYFWGEGWKRQKTVRTNLKWIKLQQEFIQKDTWILDGSYHSTFGIRLHAADTVIFLDMPRSLCLWRVIKRHYSRAARPDLPPQCKDRLDRAFIKKVWRFSRVDRPELLEKVHREGAGKTIIRLGSRGEVTDFLQKVRGKQTIPAPHTHNRPQRAFEPSARIASFIQNMGCIKAGALLGLGALPLVLYLSTGLLR